MYIERVKNLNQLFLIELYNLLRKLEGAGLCKEAYIERIVSRIDYNEFGLFIAWDEDGLHGAVHMNTPSPLFPKTSWALFAVADSTMTREESRKTIEMAEAYAKENGATKYMIDTERSTKAFGRAYGLTKAGDIMEKQLT